MESQDIRSRRKINKMKQKEKSQIQTYLRSTLKSAFTAENSPKKSPEKKKSQIQKLEANGGRRHRVIMPNSNFALFSPLNAKKRRNRVKKMKEKYPALRKYPYYKSAGLRELKKKKVDEIESNLIVQKEDFNHMFNIVTKKKRAKILNKSDLIAVLKVHQSYL